jgi:monoterpene epsilon-lactone hydrolase
MTEPTARLDADGNLALSARTIPVPKSISAAAQAYLKSPYAGSGPAPSGSGSGADFKRGIETFNAGFLQKMAPFLKSMPVTVEKAEMAGVVVYVATPHALPAANRTKVNFAIHGGGLVLLGGEPVAFDAAASALRGNCRSVSLDYRMPPDHPYPAALDDCMAVYRALLQQHAAEDIFVSGISAGGNLAGAVCLRIRDEGLKLPAAVLLMTPELDLTESGDSFHTLRDIDVALKKGLPEFNALYAGGHDLAHPYLSPLFADFSKGYPPTFIQTGTRDLFLSNAARMHRSLCNAGVAAELHVWEAMPHGGFGGMSPEDADVRLAIGGFLAKHAGVAAA